MPAHLSQPHSGTKPVSGAAVLRSTSRSASSSDTHPFSALSPVPPQTGTGRLGGVIVDALTVLLGLAVFSVFGGFLWILG